MNEYFVPEELLRNTSLPSIRSIYRKLEKEACLSVWKGEHELSTIEIATECIGLNNSPPDVQTYALSHFMFGDLRTSIKFPLFILQSSFRVADTTHPFSVIQTILHLLCCGDITLEEEGIFSVLREAPCLYPWGTQHHRRLILFPVQLLDIRAKEAVMCLNASRHFLSTRIQPLTNASVSYSFVYNQCFQAVYDHWKPLIVTLFLRYLIEDGETMAPVRDIMAQLEMMIYHMSEHGMEPIKPSERHGYIPNNPDRVEGEVPILSNSLGNYCSVVEKSNVVRVRRLYGQSAKLLSAAWRMARESSIKDIVHSIFPILCAKIYPIGLNTIIENPSILCPPPFPPPSRYLPVVRTNKRQHNVDIKAVIDQIPVKKEPGTEEIPTRNMPRKRNKRRKKSDGKKKKKRNIKKI